MTTLTEGRHAAECVLSEATRSRSRENVTIDESQTILAGQVLAIVTASGEYAAYDEDGVDGTENAAGIALYAITTGAGAPMPTAILRRDAEVNGNIIVWPSSTDAGEKTAAIVQLAALGIIVR